MGRIHKGEKEVGGRSGAESLGETWRSQQLAEHLFSCDTDFCVSSCICDRLVVRAKERFESACGMNKFQKWYRSSRITKEK